MSTRSLASVNVIVYQKKSGCVYESPSLNRHLMVVDGSEGPSDPGGAAPGGVSHSGLALGEGLD